MMVKVDLNRCHGHGLCLIHAPEIFDMNDEGRSYVKAACIDGELAEQVRRAVENCPEQALSTE
ncbi:ferredoxin [Mycolicibacterium elephantis]